MASVSWDSGVLVGPNFSQSPNFSPAANLMFAMVSVTPSDVGVYSNESGLPALQSIAEIVAPWTRLPKWGLGLTEVATLIPTAPAPGLYLYEPINFTEMSKQFEIPANYGFARAVLDVPDGFSVRLLIVNDA